MPWARRSTESIPCDASVPAAGAALLAAGRPQAHRRALIIPRGSIANLASPCEDAGAGRLRRDPSRRSGGRIPCYVREPVLCYSAVRLALEHSVILSVAPPC